MKRHLLTFPVIINCVVIASVCILLFGFIDTWVVVLDSDVALYFFHGVLSCRIYWVLEFLEKLIFCERVL